MEDVKILKTDNKIEVKKLCKNPTGASSGEIKYITIAEYKFYSNEGAIHQFFFQPSKFYKSLVNWRKAVKRIFDIDI